jgi:hypothetical protein
MTTLPPTGDLALVTAFLNAHTADIALRLRQGYRWDGTLDRGVGRHIPMALDAMTVAVMTLVYSAHWTMFSQMRDMLEAVTRAAVDESARAGRMDDDAPSWSGAITVLFQNRTIPGIGVDAGNLFVRADGTWHFHSFAG